MGNVYSSKLVPIPPEFEYMCIVVQKPNGIRVIHGSEREMSIIKEAIQETWKAGFKDEGKPKCHGYVWAYKLNGLPFSCLDESSQARRMMCNVLWKLNNAGWNLITATNLSRKLAFGTFFFVNQEVESVPCPYCCINLSSSDKLQFINFPKNLNPAIQSVIEENWSLGIQQTEASEDDDCYEIKLYGDPWKRIGPEAVEARSLIQKLIELAAQNQLSFRCAANMKSTADSLFFNHDPRLAQGETPELFTISLNRKDRVRLINAPEEMALIVRQVLQDNWGWRGGIQKEGAYSGSYEFKLKGEPWWTSNKESIMARYLISKLLETLQSHGWHVINGFDISRGLSNKSVLIFQKSAPMTVPIMCLSPSGTNKLRFIDVPDDVLRVCREIIETRWPKKISSEKRKNTALGVSCVQFRFNGIPWDGENDDKYYARSMLCFILQALNQNNWKLILSGDVSAKYYEYNDDDDEKCPSDVYSWWFMRTENSDMPPSASPSEIIAN